MKTLGKITLLAARRVATKPGEFVDFTFTARVPGPYTTKPAGS